MYKTCSNNILKKQIDANSPNICLLKVNNINTR